MERLVYSYLRNEAPVLVPLHPNQQAYQAGKSVETAFHRLVLRTEKVLDQQETAFGVLLCIEGAIKCNFYDNMCDAPVRHGGSYAFVRWSWANLEVATGDTELP